MMMDDNSILDAATAGCKDGSTVSDYLGGIMDSIHNALDPSAIITPQAVREFGRGSGGMQRQHATTTALAATATTQHSSLQKTPRRDPPQQARRVKSFAAARKPNMFHLASKQSTPFGTMTTIRPQERGTPATSASYSDSDKSNEEEDEDRLTILQNASTLTMEMMDDDDRQQTEHLSHRNDPESTAVPDEPRTPASYQRQEEFDGDFVNPYDGLLRLAAKNTLLMEKMRDEVNQLRVANAMLINDLAMVSFDSYSSSDDVAMETSTTTES